MKRSVHAKDKMNMAQDFKVGMRFCEMGELSSLRTSRERL